MSFFSYSHLILDSVIQWTFALSYMVKCFLICIIYIHWTFVYVAMKLIGVLPAWSCTAWYCNWCWYCRFLCLPQSATSGWPADVACSCAFDLTADCCWAPAACLLYTCGCCWCLASLLMVLNSRWTWPPVPADSLCFWHECWLLVGAKLCMV
jgi:hypothetical protein